MSAHLPEIIVWTSACRLPIAQRVIERLAGLARLIGVSGDGDAQVQRWARQANVPFDDDPRRLLVSKPATYTLLMNAHDFPRPALMAALRNGTVLTVEPIAARLDELLRPDEMPSPGRVIDVPAFVDMPGWTSAADPLSAIAPLRSMAISSFFQATECSLFARLHEAWRLVVDCHGMPESIDASIAPQAPGHDLRTLRGHLTAHGRWADAAGVLIQLSDGTRGADLAEAGDRPAASTSAAPVDACHRVLHAVGDAGWLRVTDYDYELFDATGRQVDRAPPTGMPPGFAEMIVTACAQLFRQRFSPTAPPSRDQQVLACCQATQLSARTNQPENPRTILTLGGGR